MSVPSNLIPTRITQLPVAPVADENSLMMIVYQGNNYLQHLWETSALLALLECTHH